MSKDVRLTGNDVVIAINAYATQVTRLREDIWRWIIDANNGCGADVGDLMSLMNRNGASCPEELEDDE